MATTTDNLKKTDHSPVNRLLDRKEVLDRTSWGRTTLWKMIKDGKFPPPRQTGLRNSRWLESDLEDYFHSLVKEV